MKAELTVMVAIAGAACGGAIAGEHDFYRNLRYPNKLVPGVGLNEVEQEGGPGAVGYKRRTVQWWPRKGQDIVEVPAGAPLRVWTRNKGQKDREALAGVCRNWTASGPETFKAHLIAFRSFGTSTVVPNPWISRALIPAAVLRMENGEQRAVVSYGPASRMIGPEDHDFIHGIWEEAYPKLYATVSQGDLSMPVGGAPGGAYGDFRFKPWKAASPRFNAKESPKDSKYPRWARNGHNLAFETPHFHLIARPKLWGGPWGQPANWVAPEDPERQNLYRKHVMEFVENFWTYVEAAGASMPYWRRSGGNHKYIVHIHGNRAAGGWGHSGVGDCSPVTLGHEFFHGQPLGGWDGHFAETMCNAGQHTAFPGELQMFDGSFQYPWRNVNFKGYGSSLWCFVLGDNPNWGYGIQAVAGCLASPVEFTAYHTIARLGQKKGLWENGVRGFGDFFGEYAARMVTCDFIEQHMVRSKYGMPEMSYVYPVYGSGNRYRVSNAEAPRWCGFNIIRLKPTEGAKEITVDFHGIHDPELHSDWRACIVAVDGNGRARYSPLWNRGEMRFALEPPDAHLWLTVSASPSAFPVPKLREGRRRAPYGGLYLMGIHAPRYPWEVTLTGCEPGLPHRRQGDVINFDELYGRTDYRNTYLNYPVKQEVPIPLTEKHGALAQEKLAAMLPRIEASARALQDRVDAGKEGKGYWWHKRHNMHGDLVRRVNFLQDNAKGHPHPNGGGFVTDNAHVAPTAYVGPNAMVLDGARVEGNACIKEFAVVLGPKTVISGNAKVSGRAWVFGDIKVSGNARILEAATVSTIWREPWTRGRRHEGQAEITGSAVIRGEQYLLLCHATDQVVTGGVVVDYTATVENRQNGVFKYGRFYQHTFRKAPSLSEGVDAGALYANWQFNQPKAVLLEDSYVNNNGILHGRPGFADDGERRYVEFNGRDQYAEAPPSVADFGELTIDTHVNRVSGSGGRLFDFGTGEDECFYLAIDGRRGRPTLVARHDGRRYRLAAAEAIPADQWARVRVEMDGSTAAIHIDGKQIVRKRFIFGPRMAFIGDRPEGNFIGCGRNKDQFFKGGLDHFRIYRKVHDDFDALGPPPFALTQMVEWSEKEQQLSDDWEGRRRAKEAELNAGAYGDMQKEIRRLEEQKSALRKSAKLDELEARAREVEKEKKALDREIHDEFRALPETVKTEQEVKEQRQQIDVIMRQIRQKSEYVKLTEDIRTRERQRGEMEKEIRKNPRLEAMLAASGAADQEKRQAEERTRQLPELGRLRELSEQERDNQKKRQLLDKYNGLFNALKLSDPGWQRAEIARRRLGDRYREALRSELDAHAGRKDMDRQLRRLREDLKALTARLKGSHAELSELEESVSAKQGALGDKRRRIEERVRSSAAYKNAEAARAAARKAIDDLKKRAAEEESEEVARLDARIAELHKQSRVLRDNTLKRARLSGANPYPGMDAARLRELQQSLKYHTTADWDYRVQDDWGHDEGDIPPKMEKWLERVRGY